MSTHTLVPGKLKLDTLERLVAEAGASLAIDPAFQPLVAAAAEVVARAAAGDAAVYGVNTGFGKLANTRIPPADIRELQRRLVLSHMCGIGAPLDAETTRLILLLKAASLSLGHSGVRQATIDLLVALFNHDALPVIPGKGSVGASGDLAPLAHLAGCLIGVGEIVLAGERMPAVTALEQLGLNRLTLEAKEGLALLNGTQVSTALAVTGLWKAERALDAALIAGAMSVDAALGSDTPFDARIQQVRGQPGQGIVAAQLRALLAGSQIRSSHLECDRVQDPYSLRCQPQVMGACHDLLLDAAGTLEREANGVSDNPLVFADTKEILSGGNFHAEPVAFAADRIAMAMAEIGSLAERRIALLTDPVLSALPAFLTPRPGLNSGLMIAQVTAAALAMENKHLSAPASRDSLPTSANQEDHVSNATWSGRRLHLMADNLAGIVAIELMAAAQGIEFRRPLRSSDALESWHAKVRESSPALADDRPFGHEIEALADRILAGEFVL